MKIFFTQEFIDEVTLISKSNSHNDCELSLIDNIFNKNIDDIKNTGTKRLGGDPDKNPFLRKRIETSNSGKSSGYRLYLWIFYFENNVYLLFIHPKTGRRSGTNLTTEKQKELVKTFKENRDNNTFIKTELSKQNKIVNSDSQEEIF